MTAQQVTVLLLSLAGLLVLARLLGAAAERLGQPAVIGEILGGILIGPTVLNGRIAGVLAPAGARPALSALAQLGLVMFMFLIGYEFDHRTVRGRSLATVNIALASMLVPFVLGVGLAAELFWDRFPGRQPGAALFMGVAMAVTAFPVLSKVLYDRGMINTPIGRQALASAAVGDGLAWSMLAVVLALADSSQSSSGRPLLLVPYVAVLFYLVRPGLRVLFDRWQPGPRSVQTKYVLVFAGLLASSAATQWMGFDAIFGAFLFGLASPRLASPRPAAQAADALAVSHVPNLVGTAEQVSNLLLPVYFVLAGMTVNLSGITAADLRDLLLLLLIAVGGKLLGTYPAARLHHLGRRRSAVLSVLMNTRGLTELVVLSVGLRAGLLTNELYSLMVAMAILTTVSTGPVLSLIYSRSQVRADILHEDQAAPQGAKGAQDALVGA